MVSLSLPFSSLSCSSLRSDATVAENLWVGKFVARRLLAGWLAESNRQFRRREGEEERATSAAFKGGCVGWRRTWLFFADTDYELIINL